jgi:Protein of unknown function (DUF1566)
VTDYDTGLMWEQKTDDGTVHDTNNRYTWSTTDLGTTPNGTVFTDFLYTLNNCTSSDGSTLTGGFGGHCDWRLPSVVELVGLQMRVDSATCIDRVCSGSASAAAATRSRIAGWIRFQYRWAAGLFADVVPALATLGFGTAVVAGSGYVLWSTPPPLLFGNS